MRLDLNWHCPLMSQLTAYPVPRHIALLYQAQWLVYGLVLPERLAPSPVSSLESIASKPSELYQRATASPSSSDEPHVKSHVPTGFSTVTHDTVQARRNLTPASTDKTHTNARDRHQRQAPVPGRSAHPLFPEVASALRDQISVYQWPIARSGLPEATERARKETHSCFDTVALPDEGRVFCDFASQTSEGRERLCRHDPDKGLILTLALCMAWGAPMVRHGSCLSVTHYLAAGPGT